MKEIIKNNVLFFSGNGNHALGKKILEDLSEYVGIDLNFRHINFSRFSDIEPDNKIPLYESIAGKTVVLYQSMFNDRLMEEFLELCWAMKRQYQAKKIIAVVPFLRFRRQDHSEKIEEIDRLRMLIDRLKHAGVDQLITVTPHSSKMMSKNCQTYGIEFHPTDMSEIFAQAIRTLLDGEEKNTLIYAPDEGSISRAVGLAQILGFEVIFTLKKRGLNNTAAIAGPDQQEIDELIARAQQELDFPEISYATADKIRGAIILMVEDEIASGETANKTGRRLKSLGADTLIFSATHAVCTAGWQRKLFYQDPFDKIFIADSIPRDYENRTGGKMHDLSVSGVMAAELYKVLKECV